MTHATSRALFYSVQFKTYLSQHFDEILDNTSRSLPADPAISQHNEAMFEEIYQ